MKIALKIIGFAALLPVMACTPTTPDDTAGAASLPVQRAVDTPGRAVEVSEDVRRVARPDQDLDNVRLLNDGCYWWLYEGVVEDTYIPVETRDGRPICARGQGTPISEL